MLTHAITSGLRPGCSPSANVLFPGPELSQVFTADIQAEVLGLLRSIITTFLPRPVGGAIVRQSLQGLLQLPDAVMQGFEQQLGTIGSENKQRALIRTLVAQAGNEEVKKLLSSVAKLQPAAGTGAAAAAAASAAKKAKPASGSTQEDDPLLGGAIFNLIFNS